MMTTDGFVFPILTQLMLTIQLPIFILIKRQKFLNTLILVILQLMHSFKVNIRIRQPENSDFQQGEAKMNITFEG